MSAVKMPLGVHQDADLRPWKILVLKFSHTYLRRCLVRPGAIRSPGSLCMRAHFVAEGTLCYVACTSDPSSLTVSRLSGFLVYAWS